MLGMLFSLLTVTVRGQAALVSEGGAALQDTFGNEPDGGGNGAVISVSANPVVWTGDTAAFWVNLRNHSGTVWAQAGYCLGECPPTTNGTWFSEPEFYVEWTDYYGAYQIHLLGSATFQTPHHFRVWQEYTSAGCVAYFSIDGMKEPYSPVFALLCGYAAAADGLEDHYSNDATIDHVYDSWSDLEWWNCGWTSWGTWSPNCSPDPNNLATWSSDSMVGAAELSNTAFNAFTVFGGGGGGGHPK
jgi:hypothetical protein